MTFVSTCFAQALLQSYLDHIRFHIVNWVALRHDAFSDAKNCPSFPAIPRPLFVASMMRRRETTSATARGVSVGKLACVIADRGAKFDHMTFCRRTACRVGARHRGRPPLYRADARVSSHHHGVGPRGGVAAWTKGPGRSGGRAGMRYFNPDVCCLHRAPAPVAPCVRLGSDADDLSAGRPGPPLAYLGVAVTVKRLTAATAASRFDNINRPRELSKTGNRDL